jgi:hypothetical protein
MVVDRDQLIGFLSQVSDDSCTPAQLVSGVWTGRELCDPSESNARKVATSFRFFRTPGKGMCAHDKGACFELMLYSW